MALQIYSSRLVFGNAYLCTVMSRAQLLPSIFPTNVSSLSLLINSSLLIISLALVIEEFVST